MASVLNVDTSGNIVNAGTVTHSILNTIGVVHNSATGLLSTSLIVAADITSATITGSKVAASTITNSNLSTMPLSTIKGNNTGGTASPLDLTVAQVKTMLGIVGSLTIGNTQVGFGNSSGNIVGSANLTWSGTILGMASGSGIDLGASIGARKISLYTTGANNFQYFGFGISAGQLEYTVDAAATDHVFYAGLTATTRQECARITGDKFFMTQAGGGIKLANSTAAYVPAVLDFNEDPFTVSMTVSGPWATSSGLTVTFSRTGKTVLMQWVGFNLGVARTVSATITSSPTSNNIPARFGTSALAGLSWAVPVLDGSTNISENVGQLALLNGAGGLYLEFSNTTSTAFSNAFAGIVSGCVSWQFK